jgi:hypothetical protein
MTDSRATYEGSGDPARRRIDYYPGWLDNLARNAAGQTQHVVVSHRPLAAVELFSRLMGEKLAGTALGEHYARAGH